jgi:glutamate-1-semialdehyde 2,1-aminomutase
LQDRGVRVVPEGIWFVSTAHTDDDVERTLAAVEDAAKVL